MNRKIIEIVVCTDKQFVMTTGVMIQSVCVNNPEIDITFHIVFDDDVTSNDKQDLVNITDSFEGKSARFYPASEYVSISRFPALSQKTTITRATYFRLFITEILPKDIERVLYLDGDIIVRHSLIPLWEIDMANKAVAAVIGSEGNLAHFRRLGYSSDFGFFNAGVLLINLRYWRDHNVLNEFKNYIEKHSEAILLHDQDVLNAVFYDKKIRLPAKYNLHHGFLEKIPVYDYNKYEEEVLEARKDPVIVHFTAEKPWDADQRNKHPFSNTFYKYQNQTKWKGVRIERRSLFLQFKHHVIDIFRKCGILPKGATLYDFIDINPID